MNTTTNWTTRALGWWVFSAGIAASAFGVERAPWVMNVGEQRLLSVPGLLRFSVGSDKARGRSGPEGLLIKAIAPGYADLWVWRRDGQSEHRSIRIDARPGPELKPGLEKAVGMLEEAQIAISAASGVTVHGRINSFEESRRIAHLVSGFPTDVKDETTLSEALLDVGDLHLSKWLEGSRYRDQLRLERYEGMLWVRGSIDRPEDRAAAERQARSAFPGVKLEIESLPDSAPTVHFKVLLLELKKSRFGALGLSWPPSQEGAFRVTSGGISSALALDLKLQALEGDGSLKILSSPELVVRAPGEAELFAGGEIPIRNRGVYQSNVQWRPFGLTLKLKVTHTTSRLVRLDVTTEVSHLDSTLSSEDVPGIQSNRMRTQVDARYGAPLLLSGLLQQGMRENARGLPALRNIPILGKLFGSSDYLNEASELVAVLIPGFTPPPAPRIATPARISVSSASKTKASARSGHARRRFQISERGELSSTAGGYR